jgi:tetratricopeptide (TPR) repeat protein
MVTEDEFFDCTEGPLGSGGNTVVNLSEVDINNQDKEADENVETNWNDQSQADPEIEVLELEDDEPKVLEIEKDLNKALAEKEEGNKYFRERNYEDALQHYSSAIAYCPESIATNSEAEKGSDSEVIIEIGQRLLTESEEVLAACYGNRSATHFALEDYEATVEDCTEALKLKPEYTKVLVRRMQSLEKLERYDEALEGKQLYLFS